MDRSLGDGGMPLLGQLGVSFERYGEGWAEAAWTPTELAGNPFGIVHGGVYGVIHDAAMNFAANSALESGDRVATLDVSYQTRRAPKVGDALAVRGEVSQLTRQVAYTESTVTDADGARRVTRDGDVHRAPQDGVTDAPRRRRDASRRPTRGPDRSRGASATAGSSRCSSASGIYLVYDWLRDQATGTERRRVPPRAADRRRREVPRAVPRVLDPAGVPRTSTGSCRSGTSGTAPSTSSCRWSRWCGSTARPRRATCAGATRWCSCSAIVARSVFWLYPLMPPRLMPDALRLRRRRRRLLQLRARRCGSTSTPTASRRPRPSAPTATSSRRCRACTWAGRRGRRSRCGRCCAARGRRCCWALYPVSIFFCIVVTANHWILDAVGGWVVLALGYLGAVGVERLLARRRHRSSITG